MSHVDCVALVEWPVEVRGLEYWYDRGSEFAWVQLQFCLLRRNNGFSILSSVILLAASCFLSVASFPLRWLFPSAFLSSAFLVYSFSVVGLPEDLRFPMHLIVLNDYLLSYT
ncbi:hypothetical protein JB92DRAFT_1626858 [Gautieria morchelliformis]|nr:hypothetical protein JB92DRAFT_1626858 [Gautieria morchelliformis]